MTCRHIGCDNTPTRLGRQVCERHWIDLLDGRCIVGRCTSAPHRRGMCPKHYHRWRRHGDPTVTRRRIARHGTRHMYQNRACRCDPCRRAGTAYVATLREARAALGLAPPPGYVAAEPTRVRLLALLDTRSRGDVAAAVGVSEKTISRIVQRRSATVRRTTAEAVERLLTDRRAA